jgi:hypothetical protein
MHDIILTMILILPAFLLGIVFAIVFNNLSE